MLVSVAIDFLISSKKDAPFHHTNFDYPCNAWDGLPGARYSIWLHLLPLLNFSVSFILELMYVLLFKNIVSNLIYLCGQGGNRCQRVFELDKLPDVDKTRKSVSFQNLRSK